MLWTPTPTATAAGGSERVAVSRHHNNRGHISLYGAGTDMASVAAGLEPGRSPGSLPLADALVPASIFAPDRGGCAEDAGDECFEDEDVLNGEPEDRGVDFTSKVRLTARP